MVIHDTERPYWEQVSLNNTNPPQATAMTGMADNRLALKKISYNSVDWWGGVGGGGGGE